MPTTTLSLPILVDSIDLRVRAYDRLDRWTATTDLRVVRRLWPRQPGDAGRALCPGCGVTLRDGMLITLNQMADYLPAGPAQQALAAGDAEALTPALPIEPGELWCVVCLPCMEDYRQTPSDPWLSERLLALVDEALRAE
jgi:hypothetical protein